MSEYTNKVVLKDGTTLIDLTGDTVEEGTLLEGATAHKKDGSTITGTCTFDADTSDATANASEILDTRTAYANGTKVIGTMPNRGSESGTITGESGAFSYRIQRGYYDGTGYVTLDANSQELLIPGNIKSGVTILGVVGTYSGGSVTAQAKTVTPSFTSQLVAPDSGYDYLSQVTVSPITVTYTDNASGGKTVTIG